MADLSQFVKDLNSLIQPSKVMDNAVAVTEPNKKLKLMIVTTHFNQVNGYSKVVWNMIQQLASQSWLSIVLFGTQKMVNADLGRTVPSSVKVIDGTALEKDKQTGFAFAELPATIQQEKPDIVLIYNDLAVIGTYIEAIRKSAEPRTYKIWAYVDLTYLAPPQAMIDVLNRDVERVFCFTSFNKNIPRKRLDLLVISFVKLIVRFPTKNIFMLIVADKGETGGYSLFDIFAREIKLHNGSVDMFGNRLLITSSATCYRDEDMNMLYNCGDVGVSCAEGEGFGLCTFEQMALGVPQVVPDINGYNEYCTSENSLMIKPFMKCYLPQHNNSVIGEAQLVNPEDVSKAMERYVFDDDLRRLHGRLGKEKAISYTWEKSLKPLVKRLRSAQEDEE